MTDIKGTHELTSIISDRTIEIKTFFAASEESLDNKVNSFLKERQSETWNIATVFLHERMINLILKRSL